MIKGCIFNLSGTIVDHYSLTLKLSLKKTFSDRGVILCNKTLQQSFKLPRDKRIGFIVNDPTVNFLWKQRFNKEICPHEENSLFHDLEKNECEMKRSFMRPMPYVHKTLEHLKKTDMKIGITSEFNKSLSTNILTSLNFDQYNMYHDLENNNIENITDDMGIKKNELLVFADTFDEIQRLKRLDYKVVGVYRWSSDMNVNSIKESYRLDRNNYLLRTKLLNIREGMNKSKPDYYIQNLNDVKYVLEKL
jgi:hypothetical protein